jgi:hypothetical protein
MADVFHNNNDDPGRLPPVPTRAPPPIPINAPTTTIISDDNKSIHGNDESVSSQPNPIVLPIVSLTINPISSIVKQRPSSTPDVPIAIIAQFRFSHHYTTLAPMPCEPSITSFNEFDPQLQTTNTIVEVKVKSAADLRTPSTHDLCKKQASIGA